MLYLIGQIFICLIIAALLGAVVGWWLRGLGCRVREDELTAELEGKFVALKSAEEKVVVLESSLTDLKAELGTSTVRLQKRIDELEPLIKTVEEREGEISDLRGNISKLGSLQEQVETANTERDRLQNELQLVTDEKVGEISRLRHQVSELETVRNTISQRETAIKDLETQHQKLIQAKDSEIVQLQGQQREYEQDRGREIETLNATIGDLRAQIAALQKQMAEPAMAATVTDSGSEKKLFETPAEKDDLKKISGIGPVLEQTLNRLGITTFEQIARFTEQDVLRVDDALAFHVRIVRDNWIGRAKVEYQKKYGRSI